MNDLPAYLLQEAYRYKLQKAREYSQKPVDWQPLPDSPQRAAYDSTADVIGYGGAAGGGKTDTLLGKAFTQFYRARIYRRRYQDMRDMIERGDTILDGLSSYVAGDKRAWYLGERIIRIGAVDAYKDLKKFQGRAADFLGIDEAAEWPESDVRYLMGWVRTERENHRTQVMLTFNPPTTAEGEWIIRFFEPWLNPRYAGVPAQPGELRWYIRKDDKDVEVANGDVQVINGVEYRPKSRTFIPARVEDNPYLMQSGYRDQLNSLPEPLRSQLLFGDFTISAQDDPYQVIPTAWVLAAMERGRQKAPDLPIRAAGVDIARGGADNTVISTIRGSRFDPLLLYPGAQTETGQKAARLINEAVPVDAPTVIDAVGVGASAYDIMSAYRGGLTAFNGGAASRYTDKSGKFPLFNLRAEVYWRLREALDPDSGQEIALPDDRDLRVELCAARYEISAGKIKIEDKERIKSRLGRSPDRADAVTMAWYAAQVAGVRWTAL